MSTGWAGHGAGSRADLKAAFECIGEAAAVSAVAAAVAVAESVGGGGDQMTATGVVLMALSGD